MQHQEEAFRTKTDCPLYFGVRYKCDEATQSDFILGLAEHDVSVLTNTSHGIYFSKVDGATSIALHVVKDETSDAGTTMGTLSATAWNVDEFLVSSTSLVECWHNNTYMGSVTAGIPSTDLAVTMAFLAGAATSTYNLFIDWVRCIQINNARTTE